MKNQNEKMQVEIRVNPGDLVPGGFSYPNNATVKGDFLYLRDANGNIIPGKQVDIGDRITVLKVLADKKLALVQYPVNNNKDVREGYVTNATNIIVYDNLEKWVNGSTNEPVFESEAIDAKQIGYLNPREKATVLFKKGTRYNVVYNTSAGVRTKSGFVDYHGNAGSNSGTNGNDPWPNITPGGIVSGGFTFPNNAKLVGGSLQLKDANGNNVSGTVSNGDSITILDVGYTKQLALVQYPTSGGVKQGYIDNNTNIIKYNDEYNWYNGTTPEDVYSKYNSSDSSFGTLSARESATKLYEYGGRVHIVYDTSKGMLTKSGYVNYKGRTVPPRQKLDLGSIGHKNARLKVYGKSGKGLNLNSYKLGAVDEPGKKIKKIFVGFALHGWEDHWRFDGEALVKIGSSVLTKLGNYISANGGLNGWQVCIAPCMNPDGLVYGRSSYGPGRCSVTTKIDMNRCFPVNFPASSAPRYYTGSTPLGAPEAVALKNLVTELANESSELMVVDCHGWLGFTQGNYDVGKYFTKQFGFSHKTQYSGGFFSTWANSLSNTKGVLLEYPTTTDDFSIVENYATKTFNAIIEIIKSSNGNGGSGSGSEGGSGSGNGDIIVGSKVRITGTHWATGQLIPEWAKNTTHTVGKIDGDRALLQEVTSWIYLKDIVLVDGGGSDSGNGGGSGSENGKIVVGSKVKITGTHWATGQLIPEWAKNTTHTVSKIDGDRALLQEVTSWIYLDDIVLVDGSESGSGNEEVSYNATGRVKSGTITVNIRKGSSTNTAIIGTLAGGAPLTISKKIKPKDDTYTWYKIEFEKQLGYIREDFVLIEYNYKKQERVVIIGAEGIARYPNFLECAVKKLRELQSNYPNDKRTLYVSTLGLGVTERSLIVDLQRTYDYECIFYTSKSDLFNYLNTSKFKISSMYFYAHGKPGALLLGYSTGTGDYIISNPSFDIYMNEIDNINFNIFANDSITEFYSCFGASPEKDFSKAWYNLKLSKTKAAEKKTNYGFTAGKTEAEISEHVKYRESGLPFNPKGALYYPELSTVSGPNKWVYYPS